jgi:hypothetical protein
VIRYFDQSSLFPTLEDLEGKVVLAKGVMNFRSFRHPGRVSRVAGDRVYIEPIAVQGMGALTAKNFISLKSIGAICDSEDEAQSIISAGQAALKSYQAHQRAMMLEINMIFNRLNDNQGTLSDE